MKWWRVAVGSIALALSGPVLGCSIASAFLFCVFPIFLACVSMVGIPLPNDGIIHSMFLIILILPPLCTAGFAGWWAWDAKSAKKVAFTVLFFLGIPSLLFLLQAIKFWNEFMRK